MGLRRTTLWCNNFIKTTTLNINRITSSQIELTRNNLDEFINQLREFIDRTNVPDTSEIISNEIVEDANELYIMYENILKYPVFLDHSYRDLLLNEVTSEIYYNTKDTSIVVTLNELINKTVKINSNITRKIRKIELINNVYQVSF